MSGVLVVDGVQWWTTRYACAQLGVDRKVINDWVRRSKQAGHTQPASQCPRCLAGGRVFPHVDPPARPAPTLAGYLAEQLLDAEAYTASSTRGNRRA